MKTLQQEAKFERKREVRETPAEESDAKVKVKLLVTKGSIKDRNGLDLTEAEDIKKR